MADEDVRVPAGWYPDPLGLPQLRWWDNHAWTEHVSDARMPMEGTGQDTGAPGAAGADMPVGGGATNAFAGTGTTIPTVVRTTRLSFADPFEDFEEDEDETAPADGGPSGTDSPYGSSMLSLESLEAPAQGQAEDELLSPAHRIAAGTIPAGAPTGRAYNLDTRFDDLLGGDPASAGTAAEPASAWDAGGGLPSRRSLSRDQAGAVYDDTPTHANTGPAWAIALLPLLMLVAGLLFLLSGLAGGQVSSTFFGIVLMAPYLLTLGLAYADWRGLQRLGFSRPASWAWAFLTAPVYLVMRTRRVAFELGGRGAGPLVSWLSLAALVVVSGLIAPGLVISLNPQSFSNEAARSVQSQAASFGVEVEVECPSVPPLLPGDSFSCSATDPSGQTVTVLVSLQRALGWISWHVDDWGGMSV